ncbi:glutathione peroxidase [Salpingoeca rosetta]|uniref:Glutathione peroxidase n=1 Tax=Salpingoeca rosetta (strain ATCC 50818 / BSB-021) TaxID=946362 RepID=F2U4C3_SALR5|nr:glutathione peroxidase [Salpingoeca rosetta]EGD82489.1 glutathione peroxidase [Salpingoeca rosetta]|eukprot:XP_004995725.1 glutathione peroxidase [Salpingoeca rosetta]
MPNLGDVFPDFEADTTEGPIKFHDWLGDSWGLLFSHPADFTPVCTTEMGAMAKMKPEFDKRNCKLIGLSCDPVDSHKAWSKDVCDYASCGASLPFPIIADDKRELAVKLGMLDPDEKDKDGMPLTARAVFIVCPHKRLKLSLLYPASTGRNIPELLRVLDSLQLTVDHKVATPANWKDGDDCMVVPSIKPEDEAKMFPKGVKARDVPSGKRYLRFTPQPNK